MEFCVFPTALWSALFYNLIKRFYVRMLWIIFWICIYRGAKMDSKVEGPWNTEKYCRPPWLVDKQVLEL